MERREDAAEVWCSRVTNLSGSISVAPSNAGIMTSTLDLSLALHLAHLCCCLSLALVLTHAPHIWRLPLSLPRFYFGAPGITPAGSLLSLLARSEVSQQQRGEIVQELLSIFSPVFFHPSFVCFHFFLPQILSSCPIQQAARLWRSRLKSEGIFNAALS